ncbi:MAG: L-rhamnose/proton symporter RhaT [Candidatus Hydrogenedentes bacterium]|nr:L-rhamnose/proton symporter RhaT [Candidatus Hydrogenedentota bacterium]
MTANPFLGVLFHAIGGLAAGTFYLPFKRVRGWSWESYWLVGGVFSWIVAPLAGALLLNPDFRAVFAGVPFRSIALTYFFGVLWGVGGLTFGLSMRYLGMSLGYAVTLGFCAVFGTLIPPLFHGELPGLLAALPGWVILSGLAVCLAGIAVCGAAGLMREKSAAGAARAAGDADLNFTRGLWVAAFSGVMSSCMAFAFDAGKPILEAAQAAGTPPTFCNTPVLVVALLGGFTTNCAWCLFLNARNGSFKDYGSAPAGASLLLNYVFSALAGATWYLQFFFYGMGTTKMGDSLEFSSWTLHMAFIIVFGNLWGIVLREWKGAGRNTHAVILAGIVILILSTVVVGWGNYLGAL